MTVPAVSLTPRPDHGLGAGASAGAILELAARDDFHRWEAQLASTGHCASPIRLAGRIDAIDRATGQARVMYDTDTEPGGVLRVACGNRREHICPACSTVYKNDARQIIRSGLIGGKGIPGTVATHPCVFATLTAPGFGPVHTTRTNSRGHKLPCRPRRDASQRRCPHGHARLAELPAWEPGEVRPWSADEAMAFLRAARSDQLYPAFVLLLLYGMRRGEVLGLRWQDIDLDVGKLCVRQQLQRIRGSLHTGPVKTRAGSRDLPIPSLAHAALLMRKERQATDSEAFGRAWQDTGLVFSTRSGHPVEPRNLDRSFRRICDHHKIRVIKVHHLRHTTASLLKKLHVPPRDAQMILGHAHISTTMQIYTHVDEEARDDALTGLDKLLGGDQ
jgi:integrase